MPDDLNVAPEGTPTPTPAPAPETNWLLSEPDDLQNSETLNQYKTREEALRGFIETKKMIGDRVKVPDENATPEEVAKFYTRLGRPETPDAYEITKPEAIPIDEDAVNRFKAKAFEMGLTKKQTEAIASDYFGNILETHKKLLLDYEAGKAQQLEVLKNRWGDEFEKNGKLAVITFNHFAPDTLKATVEREGWGNNPDFIELFHRIGVATSEDVMRGGGAVSHTSLDDQMKSADRALWELGQQGMSQNDPQYKDALAKRNALYEERYKESPL